MPWLQGVMCGPLRGWHLPGNYARSPIPVIIEGYAPPVKIEFRQSASRSKRLRAVSYTRTARKPPDFAVAVLGGRRRDHHAETRCLLGAGRALPAILRQTATGAALRYSGDFRAYGLGPAPGRAGGWDDGVLLLGGGFGHQKVLRTARLAVEWHQGFFIGVNCPDLRPHDVLCRLPAGGRRCVERSPRRLATRRAVAGRTPPGAVRGRLGRPLPLSASNSRQFRRSLWCSQIRFGLRAVAVIIQLGQLRRAQWFEIDAAPSAGSRKGRSNRSDN